MSLVVARKITHAYRRPLGRRIPALQGVDITVEAGECWGLVGPNGSGKSTLLRVLAGLAVPLTGTAKVLDHPAGSRTARRVTGYVPEILRWPRALTVNDALCELASLSSARGILTRVDGVASLMDLLPLLKRRLGSLSLGQSRRVVIAQALLDDPHLLLLDEPFDALDSRILRRLRDDILVRIGSGAACVLSSHRVEDLVGLCTHVMVLREGSVVRSGPADELLAGIVDSEGLQSLLETAP